MSTLPVAIDALVKVAHDNFIAAGGSLLPNIVWEKTWPFGVYRDNFPTIFLYPLTGRTANKGLGTVTQWRMPNLRSEVFANTYADTVLMFEQLRTAWITDFNAWTGPFAPGQGYLRNTGGIKYIEIGESRSTDWEERKIVFRRIADVTIEIGD